MPDSFEAHTVEELGRGYTSKAGVFSCLHCGKRFEEGEVYSIDGHFYTAKRAMEVHFSLEKQDYFAKMLHTDSKYNSLTATQKQLFQLIYQGLTDSEIAKELHISPSTVRHQKFTFREKAKQARYFLALYEQMTQGKPIGSDALLSPHENAKMVDDRYVITEKERDAVLQNAFSSLIPLKLRAFSPKEKKKIIILSKIAEEFQKGNRYSEKEVNAVLSSIYEDYVALRRALIEYGFMKRTANGEEYWLG